MKDTLIQELIESRMFSNASTLKGKKAETIAELAFTMILTLEMLRHVDTQSAKKYAMGTFKYQEFDTMYSSATDLYNLLVVLENQDDFSDHIVTNSSINFPKLQFKRYLRDVVAGRIDRAADRTLLYKLESSFKITDIFLKSVRRAIVDWRDVDNSEKKYIKGLLDNKFKQLSQYVDINLIFKSIKV